MLSYETSVHGATVEDFVRLRGAMDRLKLWTLSNGGCYYSCRIVITDSFELTLFTKEMTAQCPDLTPTEVLNASR